MARRKRTQGKKRRRPDPEAVLAGREEVRPEELFDLIHRVNPTGRELDPGEEARRYAQKARLQSLLVRRFGDDHVVVKAAEPQRVVSLVHRSGVKDACHAVVAELDPDARSWVRQRLDVEASPAIPDDGLRLGGRESPPLPDAGEEEDATTDELLSLARHAVDEFDYEAAERRRRLALEKSSGGVAAALELLDLLVAVLGMDPEALAIEPRLSPAAAAHPGVRTFLALAAARSGETERALGLVRGTELPRSAEVYAALAAAEIRRRDPDAAARYLEHAERHDPTQPQIPGLTREIAELRGDLQQPAESTLERRLGEVGPLAVEPEARALLARWPGSEVARQVLRHVAAHRRQTEIAEHLELAERAWETERFRDAAHHYQAAREAGSERQDLPALVERARERERQRRQEAEVAAVVERFAGGDERGGLLAYLALAESLRRPVRQRAGRPALAWLEEIDPPSSGARAGKAVAAVLVLDGALASLRQGDAGAALEELEPHAETLHGVGEARSCLREARSRVARERRERGRQALEVAREALQAGRLEKTREILEGLDAGELSSTDRARAERLQARFRHLETIALLEQEYRHHLETEDLLGARSRAGRLAAKSEDPAAEQRWTRRGDRLGCRIRAAWKVETAPGPLALAELYDFELPSTAEAPEVWLDDEGRELVLADAWQRWLFVRVVDLETSTVASLVSLRTPEPMGRYLHMVCVDGDRLWLLGQHGQVLELTRDRWEILGWRSLFEVLPQEAILEQVLVLPGAPYLWVGFRTSAAGSSTGRVIDLRSWRICRRISADYLRPILGPARPWILNSHFQEGAHLHQARGVPGRELRLPPASEVRSVAASPAAAGSDAAAPGEEPDLDGLWLLAVHGDFGADEERAELFELAPAADGALEVRDRLPLDDLFFDAAHPMATVPGSGLGFVLVSTVDQTTELLGVAATPRGLRQRYRLPVPENTVLAQDRRARRAVALNLETGVLRVLSLGPETPPPDALGRVSGERRARGMPSLHPPFFCGYPGERTEIVVTSLIRQMRTRGRTAFVRESEREFRHSPEKLVGLALALRREAPEGSAASSLARRIAERYPEDAGAALLVAEHAAETEEWEEVVQRLGSADSGELDNDRGRHLHHLLGVAHLHLGRPQEAAAVLRDAPQSDNSVDCPVAPLLAVAEMMTAPSTGEESGPDQRLVRQVVGAIRTADAALTAGDLESARQALVRRAVWQASEVQSAARLAELYLRTPDEGLATAERFRKRLVLAFYCDLQEKGDFLARRNLDLPGLAWEKTRLEEIAGRAQAWLDGV